MDIQQNLNRVLKQIVQLQYICGGGFILNLKWKLKTHFSDL